MAKTDPQAPRVSLGSGHITARGRAREVGVPSKAGGIVRIASRKFRGLLLLEKRLAWPLFFGAFLGNAGIAAAESCGALLQSCIRFAELWRHWRPLFLFC